MAHNDKYLQDEGNIALVHQHQISSTQNKIAEVDSVLNKIHQEKEIDENKLDNALIDMQNLPNDIDINIDDTKVLEVDIALANIRLENEIKQQNDNIKQMDIIGNLDVIEYNETMSWEEYLDSIHTYGIKYNLNLSKDPFKSLMSSTQQIELIKRLKDDFGYKNAKCDKYDYMIAGTCGVIGGLIDILFVGIPGASKLGNLTDDMANKTTEKFAEFCGWDRANAESKGSNTTKSAIGFLESKFKVKYDQATSNGKNGTGGMVSNLTLKNHHLKNLAHAPDIIGLFFSILNQFTSTSSFVDKGTIITIDTETFELQGNDFISRLFCGFVNWFGHLMSDWTGSSGADGRGSGIPIPFYELFQFCNFGEFGQHKQDFAKIATQVFEKGYDLRHGMAMAIPVIVTELFIRMSFVVKARFYHKKEWRECIPSANIPELCRMLCVGHGVLCIMDGADAAIRSGGEMVQFLLRTNLIAWCRFGTLALKEIQAWWREGEIDIESFDEYTNNELKRMLNTKLT